MSKRRTGGMTAIAVLNFIFGACQVGVGLFLLKIPAATPQSLQILVLLGLLSIGAGAVGIISGVGVLTLAAWGRVMCLVYAGLWPVWLAGLVLSGNVGPAKPTAELIIALAPLMIWMIYPIILILLCRKKSWRAAFRDSRIEPDVA